MRAADLSKLEDALESAGCAPRRFRAKCPSHEDRNPSVGYGVKDDGWVWVKCHAGCSREQILDALDMDWRDLAPELDAYEVPPVTLVEAPKQINGNEFNVTPLQRPSGEWTPRGEAVASYPYYDEHGTHLYTVCRTADKQFPVWRPDPAKRYGKSWSLGDTRRVLYRLPQVLDHIRAGRTIFVVEGEKDVHAIEAAGGAATCNPGGVGGGWHDDYSRSLAGAQAFIVSDLDQPGRDHAAKVEQSLPFPMAVSGAAPPGGPARPGGYCSHGGRGGGC